MKKPKSGGGWQNITYALRKAREAGGYIKFWKAMRSKNTCKTCGLGMGGQEGGMVDESGSFPEVCKKSVQAMWADMMGAIPAGYHETYTIEQLKKFTPRDLEYAGRLTKPLLYETGNQFFRTIHWEEAYDRIANKLKQYSPDETFWYSSGRSSNEAGFLMQIFARLHGTNNVTSCNYYCHQSSRLGLQTTVGTGGSTIILEDFEKADLIFLIGGNPSSNHPRLMTHLKKMKRRGGKVIVINPLKESGLVNFKVPSDPLSLLFGTNIANLYVQPHLGGDLALLWGIAKRIDEISARDDLFLELHTENTEAWLERLRSLTWEEIEEKSGVPRREIDQVAALYAKSEKTVFAWTMGITHHAHGVYNVQAIAALAAIRGMIGKPGAGITPIRGHSNIQGISSIGVTPQLKEEAFEALEEKFGVKLPTKKGMATLACMEAAQAGTLKFGFCLGGNLYGSNPDRAFAATALQNLDMLVYLNTKLNTGHAHGLAKETIILPVNARDEEPHATTQESMFNHVRMSSGGPARHPGTRSEVEVIATIAQKIMGDDGPIDWQSMRDTGFIRSAIARVIPGFDKIQHMQETREEFQIEGRTFHEKKFSTESGKLMLHEHELPPLRGTGEGEVRLTTIRSEGQFNTVVYEEEDLYRGIDRRDVILLHPDDCRRLGVHHEQPVTIQSECGQIDGFRVQEYADIKPGNAAMYYPEANEVVPRIYDPLSETPAFKSVAVRVKPYQASAVPAPKTRQRADSTSPRDGRR